MRITLTRETRINQWIGFHKGIYLGFCAAKLKELGAKGLKTILTIRLKNPRKPGFTKVRLYRPIGHTYWRWQIVGQHIESLNIFLFLSNVDGLIQKTFPDNLPDTDYFVWVRFDKA